MILKSLTCAIIDVHCYCKPRFYRIISDITNVDSVQAMHTFTFEPQHTVIIAQIFLYEYDIHN